MRYLECQRRDLLLFLGMYPKLNDNTLQKQEKKNMYTHTCICIYTFSEKRICIYACTSFCDVVCVRVENKIDRKLEIPAK